MTENLNTYYTRNIYCTSKSWRVSSLHLLHTFITSTTGLGWLQSSNISSCKVPKTHTSLGDVAGPRLWNNLPLHLRVSELALLEFSQLLKTQLFCWGLLSECLINVFPYLFNYTMGWEETSTDNKWHYLTIQNGTFSPNQRMLSSIDLFLSYRTDNTDSWTT